MMYNVSMRTTTVRVRSKRVTASAMERVRQSARLAAQVEHVLSPLEDSVHMLTPDILQHALGLLQKLGIGQGEGVSCAHHRRFCDVVQQRVASTQHAEDALDSAIAEVRTLQTLLPKAEQRQAGVELASLRAARHLLAEHAVAAETRGRMEQLFERLKKLIG